MSDDLHHPDVRPEPETIPWRSVVYGFVATFVLGAVLVFAAWASLRSAERARRPSGAFPEMDIGPRRSIAEVQQDLFGEPGFGQALNARKRAELSTFGWVDRQRRDIHIPIDVAMGIVVDEEAKR